MVEIQDTATALDDEQRGCRYAIIRHLLRLREDGFGGYAKNYLLLQIRQELQKGNLSLIDVGFPGALERAGLSGEEIVSVVFPPS